MVTALGWVSSGPHVKSSYGHTVAVFRNATITSQGLFRVWRCTQGVGDGDSGSPFPSLPLLKMEPRHSHILAKLYHRAVPVLVFVCLFWRRGLTLKPEARVNEEPFSMSFFF